MSAAMTELECGHGFTTVPGRCLKCEPLTPEERAERALDIDHPKGTEFMCCMEGPCLAVWAAWKAAIAREIQEAVREAQAKALKQNAAE